jgi:hypothetical protein
MWCCHHVSEPDLQFQQVFLQLTTLSGCLYEGSADCSEICGGFRGFWCGLSAHDVP